MHGGDTLPSHACIGLACMELGMPEGAAAVLQRNVLHVIKVVIPGVQFRHRGRYRDSSRDAVHYVRLAVTAVHCSRVRDCACVASMRRTHHRGAHHWEG